MSRRHDPDPDFEDEDDRPRSRFRCPFCGSRRKPERWSKVSTSGWVVFGVLLIVFFPLCWIGLLNKSHFHACRDCKVHLDQAH